MTFCHTTRGGTLTKTTQILDGLRYLNDRHDLELWTGHSAVSVAMPDHEPPGEEIAKLLALGWFWDEHRSAWRYQ